MNNRTKKITLWCASIALLFVMGYLGEKDREICVLSEMTEIQYEEVCRAVGADASNSDKVEEYENNYEFYQKIDY